MVDGPGLVGKEASQAKPQGIDGNKRQKVQVKPVNLHQRCHYLWLFALRSQSSKACPRDEKQLMGLGIYIELHARSCIVVLRTPLCGQSEMGPVKVVGHDWLPPSWRQESNPGQTRPCRRRLHWLACIDDDTSSSELGTHPDPSDRQ